MKKPKQHITTKTKTKADNLRSNGNAGYNFGGGIWNIVGIVGNGAVFSHINYKSDKKMLTHSTAFPNKLFNRWRWEKDVADQILYMDRDMWDSDDQMAVYNYLRELLERSGLLEEKFDENVLSLINGKY